MLCAWVPDAPIAVKTSNSDDFVKTEWDLSGNGGSPVTDYTVKFATA